MASCNVEHLMLRMDQIALVKPSDTIKTLRSRLDKSIYDNAALVTDGASSSRLLGIITQLDIATASDSNTVNDWYKRHTDGSPLAVVNPTTSREKAIDMMKKGQYHQLPVVEESNNQLVKGMLTIKRAIDGCSGHSTHTTVRKGRNS